MKLNSFKPHAKFGLFLISIISLVGTACADPNIHSIEDLNKTGGIALSWDDSAHIDPCYQYLTLFQKYNATCTMNVNDITNRPQNVKDELNALHLAGWEIASHGYNHVNSVLFLGNSTPKGWLNQEIFPSIVEVAHYNNPVRTLAYPYSARNANSDAILTPYFRTLRTRAPSLVNGNVNETKLAYYKWDDARLLYGVEIDDWSGASLQSIEHGIDHAIETGTVLVLYGHQITPNVTISYETSTSRLESILDYTKRHGGVFYHMGDLGNSSWVPPSDFPIVTANYTVSTNSLLAGKSVTFVDYSINPIVERLDFGDGSLTSSTANVTHIYTTPGIYTVNLTVTNGAFNDSMLKTITVIKPIIPVASFTSNYTIGVRPLNIAFTDKSTGFPTSWAWDFGDGNTSTSQNPVHEYSDVGNYSVALTVANDKGSNYTQKVNYVSVLPLITKLTLPPSSSFSSNITSGNIPLTVQFTDTSSGSPTSWNWDFGDGYTSTEQNPTHTYLSTGIYCVNLTISNVNGTASKTATITVQAPEEPHHSSGGGGGGGGSPEPQSNVQVKELSQAFISSGKSVKFDFLQKVTPVVCVSFDSNKTAGKTTTIVEMLKEKSTLVSGLPSGEVYKSLNIWVGNSGFATSKNIENAVVNFKVEKSWIQDKKIDQSSITLNRYSDKTWNQLPTSLSGGDDKYLYFTAQTPGFSPFAITGKIPVAENIQPSAEKTQPSVNATQNNTNTGSIAAITEKTPEQKESPSPSQKQSPGMPGFEAVCGIAGILAVFFYTRK